MDPTTFDEMTEILMDRQIINDVQTILTCDISPRVFLSAWLISRFPEAIENTEDQSLKATADAVVQCCQGGFNITPILTLFETRFNSWKNKDLSSLRDELYATYHYLNIQQLSNPESAEILENTKKVILEQARKIGGENFVQNILSN
tara:strand:- start:171 stop:611 length:441 start_codon:yes stop_codon:yes gene_type:complete